MFDVEQNLPPLSYSHDLQTPYRVKGYLQTQTNLMFDFNGDLIIANVKQEYKISSHHTLTQKYRVGTTFRTCKIFNIYGSFAYVL